MIENKIYDPLYTTTINNDNDAVIARGELDMICMGHFYKPKNSFYMSYPVHGKEDIMHLLKATNLYAELTNRYFTQQSNKINHADFEMLLQDSCYIFSKEPDGKERKKRELYPLTKSLLCENELPDLMQQVFPNREVFIDAYHKFNEISK